MDEEELVEADEENYQLTKVLSGNSPANSLFAQSQSVFSRGRFATVENVGLSFLILLNSFLILAKRNLLSEQLSEWA